MAEFRSERDSTLWHASTPLLLVLMNLAVPGDASVRFVYRECLPCAATPFTSKHHVKRDVSPQIARLFTKRTASTPDHVYGCLTFASGQMRVARSVRAPFIGMARSEDVE